MGKVKSTKEKQISAILRLLDSEYGTDDKCYLSYEKPYELLFSTIMSAQCTDERVNMVTAKLYKKYDTLESFADADIKELEKDIHSVGFYHMKAKHIKEAAQMLLREYGGHMPSGIEELTKLPGVGRKTANVVRGHIFNEPSIVVDTHVKRTAFRLGITDEKDPVKVEFDLMKKLPKDHWTLINLQLIRLGREICRSQKPKCDSCFLAGVCSKRSL